MIPLKKEQSVAQNFSPSHLVSLIWSDLDRWTINRQLTLKIRLQLCKAHTRRKLTILSISLLLTMTWNLSEAIIVKNVFFSVSIDIPTFHSNVRLPFKFYAGRTLRTQYTEYIINAHVDVMTSHIHSPLRLRIPLRLSFLTPSAVTASKACGQPARTIGSAAQAERRYTLFDWFNARSGICQPSISGATACADANRQRSDT